MGKTLPAKRVDLTEELSFDDLFIKQDVSLSLAVGKEVVASLWGRIGELIALLCVSSEEKGCWLGIGHPQSVGAHFAHSSHSSYYSLCSLEDGCFHSVLCELLHQKKISGIYESINLSNFMNF